MPVDAKLLTDVNSYLRAMDSSHCKGNGLDILTTEEHWRNLSKTASYCIPGLVSKTFKLLVSTRDQLTQLHENPELVAAHKKIIDLQAELLQCKNEQLQSLQATVKTSVEDTVKAEFKSYSKVLVQERLPQPAFAHETVKTIVQAVVQEEDRSRSFMVFNLPEEEKEQLCSKVGEVLQEIDEKPRLEACRLGPRSEDNTKIRPVKVMLSNIAAVNQVLAKARMLRNSSKHNSVYISQDRTPAERQQHRLLVAELRKKRDEDTSTRYYIKGGVICDGGPRKDK
jgi:hypothetical protein